MAGRSVLHSCPAFARAASAVEIGPIRTSVRDRPQCIRRAAFASTARWHEDERVQRRYGTANEPPPHLVDNQPREGRGGTTDTPAKPNATKEEPEEKQFAASPLEDTGESTKSTGDDNKRVDPADAVVDDAATNAAADELGKDPASTMASKPDPPPVGQQAPSSKPLETVLNMPPPENMEDDKPPPLHPPPYIHHFDTFGIVQRLDSGGFTNEQSTTIMKAVRTILAENMDLARRGLVSKSNVENETYLFKAACSELKTELENNRKGELDKNRTRRALLQHEVDILGQKITQEVSGLKDELKGMFDDRKMTQRNEQRNMENIIQELNYKITVALNSDAKTEVEGVRWVLTRRAATALGVSVLMILATLNYARYMSSTQEKERKQHEQLMKDAAAHHETASIATQTDGGDPREALLAGEGVSLG